MRQTLLIIFLALGLIALTGCGTAEKEAAPANGNNTAAPTEVAPTNPNTPVDSASDPKSDTSNTETPAGIPPTPQPADDGAGTSGQDNIQPGSTGSLPKSDEVSSDNGGLSYYNDAFRDISVKKTGTDTYTVTGKARIFEAVVEYVIEDGHDELAKGSVTASAGAPNWGDFTATIKVKKAEPNSTLLLILFETSAKDGSRQNELMIPLPTS